MSDQPYPSYPVSPESSGSYQPPPANVPNHLLRPARGLAIAAASLAVVFALVDVVEAGLAWLAQGAYLDAADKGQAGFEVWTPYDFMVLPYFAVGIAAYVVTCLWLAQARSNVEILRPYARHSRSKGWVWGGWLVPVVSLWFPFQVVRDITIDPREPSKGSTLLGWWWAFWLMSLVSGQIGARLVPVDEIDRDVVAALGPVETINAVIAVVGLILWFKVIHTISDGQDRAMGIARG